MNSSAPRIGFDRFIQLEWVASVLEVRAGVASIDELNAQLEVSDLGKEARAKTRTKLNSFGLQPRAELADFIDRGLLLAHRNMQNDEILAYAWGVAVVTYPFFGRVAELVGRLTSIQGDCSISEIHRRMSEVYGDRAVTKRAVQAVLQSQANWGVLTRVEKGRRLNCLPSKSIDSDELTTWLIEGAVRYTNKPVSIPSLQSLPVLFPFTLTRPLAYVVSNSPNLSLRLEGPSNQLVALQDTL